MKNSPVTKLLGAIPNRLQLMLGDVAAACCAPSGAAGGFDIVGSIKFVKQALISTGEGWLDAEPEIKKIQPHIYAVNEDGDHGGKREYCRKNGIEYLVLKRTPAPGLPLRSSTDLRGF